jgi:hypothetical protein
MISGAAFSPTLAAQAFPATNPQPIYISLANFRKARAGVWKALGGKFGDTAVLRGHPCPHAILTDATVKRLALPAKASKIIFDDQVKGFGVRITANGARSYVLRYRTRGSGINRTYTIGRTTTWRTTEARAEARRLKQLVDQGQDPMRDLQEERDAETMGDLIERFEAEHLPSLREGTQADYRRLARNHMLPILGKDTKETSKNNCYYFAGRGCTE